MISYNKSNIIIFLTSLVIFIFFLFLPFSIYGQDGYFLWFPIVAEYLVGDSSYHASEVIFNGQNLAGIYGELPFWKIIRLFNPSIETFLNLTHAIWVILFSILSLTICWGIKNEKQLIDIFLLFLYSLFTPIAINRVMAGHLNLLFGVLPFFVLVSLIFNKSNLNCIFGVFCLWCALSTQAFQILSYHVFYIPLLGYLIWKFEVKKRKYFILVFAICMSAFALNYENFLDMFHHATNPNNLRVLHSNMVYTYTVSTFMDSLQFLISGIYPEMLQRHEGFFHEINYPLGAFVVMLFFVKRDIKFSLSLLIGLIFLFSFCMNMPLFNILSEVPYFIKPYRVPQRVFMIIALFIPLWSFSRIKMKFNGKYFSFLLVLIIISQFISYFEFLAIFSVIVFLYHSKFKNTALAFTFAFSGLTTGTIEKLSPALAAHNDYVKTKIALAPLQEQLSPNELRKARFHFTTAEPRLVNYVAQSMGISTLEGYGHPPVNLLNKFIQVTNLPYPANTNSLYLPSNLPEAEIKFSQLGITKVVTFDLNNKVIIQNLK